MANRSRPAKSRPWRQTAWCWRWDRNRRHQRSGTHSLSVAWDDGVVEVDENMMTGCRGVFRRRRHGAIGANRDCRSRARQTRSASHRRLSAQLYLRKTAAAPTGRFQALHLRYYTDAQQREQASPLRSGVPAIFDEVASALDRKRGPIRGARCYSCGNCFECDGCFGACPEDAIIKLGKGNRYEINYDLCTGCQACFLQCPCHAMEMVNGTRDGEQHGQHDAD